MNRYRFFAVCLLAVVMTSSLYAEEKLDVQAALSRPLFDRQLPLQQVQQYTQSRVPKVPTVETVEQWEKLAGKLRQQTLEKVVYRGEAATWRDAPGNVQWLETIEGGPGYSIQKLRYEAVPGLWIPALLYKPDHLQGKVPVVLNVNGHDRTNGKAAKYKQIRCINQAKRGMLALNVEWLGMGQLHSDNFSHARMNQIDLCGTSGLAPFYLSMKRGLDVLLSLENADPKRVAVAGLSGGGWQTIVISALDTRVTLSNPVAGYSSFRTRSTRLPDLGDSEQTPVDLATIVDYTHLTAMRAPRPTLLTFNAEDDCCFKAEFALPPLVQAAQPIFNLYGQKDNLRSHVNHDPGDHNFELDNRQALYRMFKDHFYPEEDTFQVEEITVDAELKTKQQLHIEVPEKNNDFHTLAINLSQGLPRDAKLPWKKQHLQKWQQNKKALLEQVVRAKKYEVRAVAVEQSKHSDGKAVFWRLNLGDNWTVPAVELSRSTAKSTVIVVADGGRKSAADEIENLLQKGHRVLAVDPFYFGESKISQRDYLYALLISALGDRPLGLQASQLESIARWAEDQFSSGPVHLVAIGPRSSLFSLVATVLEDKAIGSLMLHDSFGSLHQILEQNMSVDKTPELFCFGLLKHFDIQQLAALAAPRKVRFIHPSERVRKELVDLEAWYRQMGVDFQPLQ